MIRTCIGCLHKRDKYTMYRVIRIDTSKCIFDPSGKRPGRGSYVCSLDCLKKVSLEKKFNKALRMRVSQDDIDKINADIENYIHQGSKGV